MRYFNSNDLLTGYIKQVLHNFNLPKIRVYNENEPILETIEIGSKDSPNDHTRYIPYIKDNEIQEYIDGQWISAWPKREAVGKTRIYNFGQKILNYTKNLKITNNSYDTYTHEYLGDYLRFIRDYKKLDLMPLYNCFSNNGCTSLNIKDTIKLENPDTEITFNFSTSDPNYKIFMMPVKLFKHYTIAIDSALPIELCCAVYGQHQDNRSKFKDLPKLTYEKHTNCLFNQPFLYDKLDKIKEFALGASDVELAQSESDLKLFLKLPINNTSTIVILEGDYRQWKDGNKAIINLEQVTDNLSDLPLITPLQLLRFNTGKQHPFADRLIEYLLENAIVGTDEEIADNIKRTQKVVSMNDSANNYHNEYPGVWDYKLNKILYEYLNTSSSNNNLVTDFTTNHDILGYVDKDVEKLYHARYQGEDVSILNVELNKEEL